MGFNRELFLDQPVDKDFICGICLDVLQSPTTACAEGHTYCRSCLTQTLAQSVSPKCPECRDEIMTTFTPCRPLQNLILRQKARCSIPSSNNKKKAESSSSKKRRCTRNGGTKGCSWTGKVSDLEKHHETCGYADVTCTLGCERVLPRGELREHETSECEHRTVSCSCCDEKLQSRYLSEHLLEDCPKAIVTCDFCKEQMPREDLGSGAPLIYQYQTTSGTTRCTASLRSAPGITGHYKTCGKIPFRCEFFRYGCASIVKQEDLAAHYQSHAEQHALLLRTKLEEVDEQIEDHRDWSSEVTIVWHISLGKLTSDEPLALKSSSLAVEGVDMYLRLDTEKQDENSIDEDVKLSICAKDPICPRIMIDSVSVTVDLPNTWNGGYHDPYGAHTLRSADGGDPCYTFSLVCKRWDDEVSKFRDEVEEVSLLDLFDGASYELSLRCSFRVQKPTEVHVECEA